MALPLQDVLQVFAHPTTTAQASDRFGCTKQVLDGFIAQLKARGLVTLAEPGLGACSTGCGSCSMQNFCPSSDTEPAAVSDSAIVWRLTKLGLETLNKVRS